MTKVLSHVILVLYYMKMVQSNVRKKKTTKYDKSTVVCDVRTTKCEDCIIKCERKNKRITKCDKITITYDVGTAQCEDSTIKCEKKIKQPSNVTKVQSHMMFVMHNTRMIPSNVRKKNMRTIECDKSTVTCDFGTA